MTLDDAIVAERLGLLSELLAIGVELDRVEQQHGRHPDIDAARCRQRTQLAAVRAQLAGLMAGDDTGTVH